VLVFNKTDAADQITLRRLEALYPDAVFVSALEGDGIADLQETIAEALERQTTLLHLAIPYERGDVVASAYRLGEVIAVKHDEEGTLLDVRVPPESVAKLAAFATAGDA